MSFMSNILRGGFRGGGAVRPLNTHIIYSFSTSLYSSLITPRTNNDFNLKKKVK